MKITELTPAPLDENKLVELLDKDNTTGFLTQDLIKIAQADKGPWSKPMSADDLQDEMDSWE